MPAALSTDLENSVSPEAVAPPGRRQETAPAANYRILCSSLPASPILAAIAKNIFLTRVPELELPFPEWIFFSFLLFFSLEDFTV